MRVLVSCDEHMQLLVGDGGQNDFKNVSNDGWVCCFCRDSFPSSSSSCVGLYIPVRVLIVKVKVKVNVRSLDTRLCSVPYSIESAAHHLDAIPTFQPEYQPT
jgi:hypothetical protein